jgi:hypothetical protein
MNCYTDSMKMLVTGGAGFIGTNFVYSFPRSTPSGSSWDEVPPRIHMLPDSINGPYTNGHDRVSSDGPLRVLM